MINYTKDELVELYKKSSLITLKLVTNDIVICTLYEIDKGYILFHPVIVESHIEGDDYKYYFKPINEVGITDITFIKSEKILFMHSVDELFAKDYMEYLKSKTESKTNPNNVVPINKKLH